ncbi:hypothetical protein NECAME_05243 [Necator americanus]|uniref:Uncharacterized protein n=1 Tax=Necator americanus TaxID=51031 RepID=W2SIW2_NECAM|nr:hypothetical protein NECAME_05243 [Necator americanus]ETN69530.1 hypothetical protein NECAME_05243 [Necator americanus]
MIWSRLAARRKFCCQNRSEARRFRREAGRTIKRGHEKLLKQEKRKLEKQVHRRRKETAAKELARKETGRMASDEILMEAGEIWIEKI